MIRNHPGPRLSARCLVVLAGCLVPVAASAQRSDLDRPDVGVRSHVLAPQEAPERGRVYSILSVQGASSEPWKTPLVDEDALAGEVCHELDAQGFRPAAPGQKPEILVTVHYGRAWLRNPYLSSIGDTQAIEGISSVAGLERRPNRDVTGATNPLMDMVSRGYEEKVQRAAAEKLYLRVTGWKYPDDPKAKARMLWETTMLVDDPDHWDLNTLATGMLRAGGAYFNRAVAEPEIAIHPPPRNGSVQVGTPEVVGSAPPSDTPAPPADPPAAAAIPAPAETKVRFDLSAGLATETLQAFTRQTGVEIIYPIEQIRALRTRAVSGELAPRAALDRMLDGTGFTAVQDEKTGAFTLRPVSHRR